MKAKSILLLPAVLLLAAANVQAEEGSWVDSIDFSGDIRLRYELIDEEFEIERNRTRFRTRFGFTADVQENVKVVLRLATGGSSPVSTNQTLDGGFTRKDIGLDLAYVDWRVNDSLTINAGKMKNPLFKAGKSPLVWDSDLNPEGIAAKISSGNLFATLGAFSAEERSAADDSLLFAAQAGMKFPLGDAVYLTAGVGYFAYTETIGNAPFFDGNPRGNSVDLNGDLIYDYKNTEVFAQLNTELAGWPFMVYAHFTKNSEANAEDSGYSVGAQLGSAKDKGDTQILWFYQDLEADAVVATFTDSNFGGGGTDADGHVLKAKYGLSKKIFLGGSLFLNERDRVQGNGVDYTRVQIDLEFKFD